MIARREVRNRIKEQRKPIDAEFSRVINGIRFYYKKSKALPWLNYRFSYLSGSWVLDN